MPWWRTSTAWLIGWLAVALALRLAAAIVVERIVTSTPGRLCLIEGDADGYWRLGQRLATGESYEVYDPPRRILRMPGFPLVLALSQRLFGTDVFPARCLLVMIATLGCGLVYVLGRDLVDDSVGLGACAAVSLSPPLILFSPLLLSETTFATALVASLIPLVRVLRRLQRSAHTGERIMNSTTIVESVLAGLLIAVATYMRPTWLPVAGFGALAIVLWGRGQRVAIGAALSLIVVCGLALAPWVWRNYEVSGHIVPTTLWVGPSLYDGLNPGATGDSNMTFFDQENLLAAMSEFEMDQTYRQRAWAYALAHPSRAAMLAVIKAGRYWSLWPNASQFQQPLAAFGFAAVTVSLFGLAIAGLWWNRRDGLFVLCTWGPAVFFSLIHMLFVGSIRYRLPAEMTLWIAAAAAAVHLWRTWNRTEIAAERTSTPWAV